MFSIFRKKRVGTISELVADVIFPDTRSEIEAIHNEFENASNKALMEANIIINAPFDEKKRELADMLRNTGFTRAKLVLEEDRRRSLEKMSSERVASIKKYSQKYPHYKFIFNDQVETICKKYGLICGVVDLYKGEVPEKNIREIADFKVADDDIYCLWRGTQLIPLSQAKGYPYSHLYPLEKRPFYICAPKSDMNIDSKKHVLNGIFVSEVPDPIVLHWLPEGYLIVSKWGLEASDPMTLNEKDN